MEPPESEFNPAEYPPEYITVGLDEAMPSVLNRVEEAWMRTPYAVLIIPRGSHAFHSTHDFLALGKLQDSREVRVSIASTDPIITGLARLLGFYVVDPPPGHAVLADDPRTNHEDDEEDHNNPEQPTAPLPLGVLAPPVSKTTDDSEWVIMPQGPPGLTTSTWLNNPSDYAELPPRQASAYLQPTRAGIPPPRTRPRQTGYLLPPVITDTSALPQEMPPEEPAVRRTPDVLTQSGRLKARRVITEGRAYQNDKRVRYGVRINPVRWGRTFTVLAVLLIAALIGGSAYAYVYLPEATISVTPLSQEISKLPVDVTVWTASIPGGNSRDAQPGPSANAAKIVSPLVEEGTRPTTGTRQVARGRAQGIISFTNRTGGAVAVPAGTQFKAANGLAVQITQGGTVPATIFGQSFGNLNLPVAALVDGPDGNIGAGQIAGIYGGTLNYTNSALQGGSIETIKTVKQEDIDALVAELRSKVEARAANAVLSVVGSDQQIITQTISLQNTLFQPNRKAGEDGDSVSVKLTAEAQAYTYREGDMQAAVTGAVRDYMQTNFPDEVSPTLMRDVSYSPPQVAKVEADRVMYRTEANGRVVFALTPKLETDIQNLVKGHDVEQARTLIQSQTFSSYMKPDSIQARLLWFTINKLPSDPARISVERSSLSPNTTQP